MFRKTASVEKENYQGIYLAILPDSAVGFYTPA